MVRDRRTAQDNSTFVRALAKLRRTPSGQTQAGWSPAAPAVESRFGMNSTSKPERSPALISLPFPLPADSSKGCARH